LSPHTPWLSSFLPTPKGWLIGGEPSTASIADNHELIIWLADPVM
jgi:hypothetical protein